MSFSSQILTFLSVAAIYVGFAFVWAWYKGRQETRERRTQAERPADGQDHGGDH